MKYLLKIQEFLQRGRGLLAGSSACVVFLTGCSAGEKLVPLLRGSVQTTTTASASFCTESAESFKNVMKFIFVIDNSGSNRGNAVVMGTDVDRSRRYGAMETYLAKQKPDDFIYYSLIEFNNDSRLLSDFTNDLSAFSALVSSQRIVGTDFEQTGFVKALTQTELLITNDILQVRKEREADPDKKNPNYIPQRVSYVIFFLSDGRPQPGPDSDPPQQTDEEIVGIINDIKKNQSEPEVLSINLNTIYYYGNGVYDYDQQARSIMGKMAMAGLGEFLEVGKDEIDFAKFKLPEQTIPMELKDVFVTNLNAVWYEERLSLDSDTDGLADLLEERLGSNPLKYDSDGNGLSDLVEYRSLGKPCQDADCSPRIPVQQCGNVLDPSPTGWSPFIDTDGDGLNDCEEGFLLLSSIFLWDSNLNLLPDLWEFRGGLNFIMGTDQSNADLDNDGYNNYVEIGKFNTPIDMHNSQIKDFDAYKYELHVTDPVNDSDCYNLTVDHILSVTDSDLIRVCLVETSRATRNINIIKCADKRLSEGRVTFDNNDFSTAYRFECAPSSGFLCGE